MCYDLAININIAGLETHVPRFFLSSAMRTANRALVKALAADPIHVKVFSVIGVFSSRSAIP